MPGWLADISSKVGSLIGNRTPSAHFGAFGKHPGWNDHLDDLGLDSEPLIAAKQYIYVQGIGGVVDAGLWEALPSAEALAEFRHIFVWMDGRDALVGKLWSSSDGKGRTKYPMVVCAHFSNRTQSRLPDLVPLLDQLEQSCRATTSADDVRRLIAQARHSAALLLNAPPIEETPKIEFAGDLGLDPSSEASARIAYSAESHFAPLGATGIARTRINLKLGQFNGQPQHIRVPAIPGRPFASHRFWHDFLAEHIPASAPQLYIVPIASPWLDVIVGLPTAKQLFCLRAGEKVVPLASQIPFTLTGEFRAKAADRWRGFLKGA
ncbi:MAG: hypothetical protein ABMA01_10735 [Chthoniobacteraceae bacterium]|jgi:hypothetical protein